MLSLHLLQISLVYIQTLLIQQLLAEPAWTNKMTKEDLLLFVAIPFAF